MLTKTLPKSAQSFEVDNIELYVANRIPGIMESLETIQIIILIAICIIIILGVAILWNQRKIKKMLRRLEEQNACGSFDEAKTNQTPER